MFCAFLLYLHQVLLFVLIDWIRDATLTAMSTSSVNVEMVAGSEFHPSLWKVKREDWSDACTVSDNARLKDCTAYYAHAGRNLFRIGGKNGITYWAPTPVYKNTLTSNRKVNLTICISQT